MESQSAEAQRVYKKNDPAMPREFRTSSSSLLGEHLENNGNPEYRRVLANIINAGCVTRRTAAR